MRRKPPSLRKLLTQALGQSDKPAAFVLAGHNGSGKSSLWYQRLAPVLQVPLVNADRLTLSILPDANKTTNRLPLWAQKLRDDDERWQRLSQEGVKLYRQLIMAERVPFAFETVFSHWVLQNNGTPQCKADDIRAMQKAGYFVVLLFVGLTSPELSVARVQTRKLQGGHDVPLPKLMSRFPRTQAAIGYAAPIADMTLMFDNSRTRDKAFALVRAQRKRAVFFDIRNPQLDAERSLLSVATPWLNAVCGAWGRSQRKPPPKHTSKI
jgi:predicted ABC-type ATPase